VNTDFLATVAHFLKQPLPPGGAGRPMESATDREEREGKREEGRGKRGEIQFPPLPPRSGSQGEGAGGEGPPNAVREFRDPNRKSKIENRKSDEGPPNAVMTPELLAAAYADLIGTARLQNAFGGLPTLQMFLVLLSLALLARHRSPPIEAGFATAIVALPLGMLLLPPLAPGNLWIAGGMLAAFTLAWAGAAWELRRRGKDAQPLFYGLCALLVCTVAIDLLLHSPLLRIAWMSYSAVEGARFYGIGNEYMGAVIGAACVLLACPPARLSLKTRRATPPPDEAAALSDPAPEAAAGVDSRVASALTACLFAALVVVMGAPGAKVGAIPSAGAAFGIALLTRKRGSVRSREALGVLAAAVLVLAVVTLLDLRHTVEAQSHLARAFSGAGGGSILGIARRKLLLEGYLLLHSPWSATLLLSAAALAWFWRHHRTRLLPTSPPYTTRAVLAGLASGALASLVCNDSGVTAAALILLYGWAWSLLRLPAPDVPSGENL
jgi:hypothetical protein